MSSFTVQDGVPGPLSAYRGTVHALRSIVKEEGWRALYSGLAPGLLGAGQLLLQQINTHSIASCQEAAEQAISSYALCLWLLGAAV